MGVNQSVDGASMPVSPSERPGAVLASSDKLADTKFLAKEFHIPEQRAARAVLGEQVPDSVVTDLGAEVHRQLLSEDPLRDVPTPEEPSSDLISDTDEIRLKPVVHKRNDRTGAG
jgi:hypothetical protein